MAHIIQVVRNLEFLRLNITGRIDLAACKQILKDTLAILAPAPHRDLLIDARLSDDTAMTSTSLFDVLQEFRGTSLGVLNRLAILPPPQAEFDRARFFEMLATDRGLQVAIFEEFEAAFEWLSCGKQSS